MDLDKITDYVINRDKAVIACWEESGIGPLNEFINENREIIGDRTTDNWNEASIKIKWLTLCNMTLSITTKEVAVYRERAAKMYVDIMEGNI